MNLKKPFLRDFLGTPQHTKIIFCLLELLHMIGRIEVQHEIAYARLNLEEIEIPNKRKGKMTIYRLPSDDEITILKAKQGAIQIAESFGMTLTNVGEIDVYQCHGMCTLGS